MRCGGIFLESAIIVHILGDNNLQILLNRQSCELGSSACPSISLIVTSLWGVSVQLVNINNRAAGCMSPQHVAT